MPAIDEPAITINGTRLEDRDAMTVRVAIESFAADLDEPDHLGDDEHGKAMVKGYKEAINRIRRAIFRR